MHVQRTKLQEIIRQHCFETIKDSGDERRKIVDFEVVVSEEEYSDDNGGFNYDAIRIYCLTETVKRGLKNRERVWLF